MHLQLRKQTLDVVADGRMPHSQLVPDLAQRPVLGQECEDLMLAVCQC
jgi:hypothetical protein